MSIYGISIDIETTFSVIYNFVSFKRYHLLSENHAIMAEVRPFVLETNMICGLEKQVKILCLIFTFVEKYFNIKVNFLAVLDYKGCFLDCRLFYFRENTNKTKKEN